MSSAPKAVPAAVKDELAWELVRHALDARLEKGLKRLAEVPPSPPTDLHLELTHRCNLKCVMCEHWELETLDPASVGREVDFDGIRTAVEASRLLSGVKTVVVTGGEPWLRHDFVDVVAWLSGRFPAAKVVLLTNLWNTGHVRKKLLELRARGAANLSLGSSLDGLGATHDLVRGQAGAFDGLVRTVKALRAEFPEYPFGFTYTLVPQNAGALYETWAYAQDVLGAPLGAQWAVQSPGVAPIVWTAEEKETALAQMRRVCVELARRKDAAHKLPEADAPEHQELWAELLYWRWLEVYGREPRRFPFFRRCGAGETAVMAGAEGELYFCPVNRSRTFGTLKGGIDAAWSSEAAAQTRAYVDSCRCDCWLRCMAAPAVERLLALARL